MDKAVVTGIFDALAITVVVLAGRFLSPGDVELIKVLVAAWQPIAVSLVVYFAYREKLIVEEKRIESEERQTQMYNRELFKSMEKK